MIVTPKSIQAVGNSIILERLKATVNEAITKGGIIVQSTISEDDNGYAIGEVLSVGETVTEITPGQLLLFRANVALGLPNGFDTPVLYRIEKTSTQIVGIVDAQKYAEAQPKPSTSK